MHCNNLSDCVQVRRVKRERDESLGCSCWRSRRCAARGPCSLQGRSAGTEGTEHDSHLAGLKSEAISNKLYCARTIILQTDKVSNIFRGNYISAFVCIPQRETFFVASSDKALLSADEMVPSTVLILVLNIRSPWKEPVVCTPWRSQVPQNTCSETQTLPHV